MDKKSGITMISIVLYSLLFFSFTAFAATLSANMNKRIISERGVMYINEQYSKLQYNLFKSAKDSNRIDIVGDKIVFSNNDEYYYNASKKTIYKNGGMLVSGVESFALQNTSIITQNALVDSYKYVCYTVTLLKYDQTIQNNVFVTVGG
jgi:hypothetical protein